MRLHGVEDKWLACLWWNLLLHDRGHETDVKSIAPAGKDCQAPHAKSLMQWQVTRNSSHQPKSPDDGVAQVGSFSFQPGTEDWFARVTNVPLDIRRFLCYTASHNLVLLIKCREAAWLIQKGLLYISRMIWM
jgi:hypothetical protein